MNDKMEALLMFLDTAEVFYCRHHADADWWALNLYTHRN